MKENFKTYKWILSQVRSFVPALIVISIIKIVASYLGVRYSLVMKDVIDAAIGGTGEEFKKAIIIMVIYVAVMIILRLINRNLTQVTDFKMNRMWKQEMMQVILDADYQKVSKYHSGNLLSRMSADVKAVDTGLTSFVPGILALITKLITAIVIMGTLAPQLTLIICICGLIVVLISTVFRKRLKELHKNVQEANAKVTSFIQEALERLHMVQALDVSEEIEKREDDLLEKRYKTQVKRKNLGLLASGGLSIICVLAELGIILWSVLQLRAGYISFGTLTAMVTLFLKLEAPFISISGILPQYTAMMGSADRIREIYDLEEQDDATGQAMDKRTDNFGCKKVIDADKLYESMTVIAGRNIWFKYDDEAGSDVNANAGEDLVVRDMYAKDEYVIKGLSFDIPKGCFCAVTGSSGIGKSTLMKLLLGMCRPDRGELKAGDIAISRATRALFAYVPQGNMLLSGSLRDNLLLTKPDASEDDIIHAIHVADMEEFVAELPDGLDTMIGENALGISEGQAQRVSIARAVLSGKPIILLDEATSNLDAETELRVLENIRALDGRMVIAVTHRHAAREMSDCVIEM